ncbi:MAG TPA: CU044_5270 family protein [Actinokineospora sp.]|nr:CU044_5270 family protein [Actinokineospora sp.]
MTDGDPRELWSDDDLDHALERLNPIPRTDPRTLAGLRAELMAAAGASAVEKGKSMGMKKRWIASAAAVVAVAAGVLVAQTVSFNGNPPTASAAAAELNSVADRVRATDPPVGPGQYTYVGTRAWYTATGSDTGAELLYAYLEENRTELWVPPVFEQEWMQRRATGEKKWIFSSEAELKEKGIEIPDRPHSNGERRAPCGDFFANSDEERCKGEVGWQKPSPQFIASLPKDAKQLHDRIRHDTQGRGKGPDLEFLVYVADFLRSGVVPADTRANLYRALAMVPTMVVTDRAANLDGRTGVAFGVEVDGERREIIIDVSTGQFIGERQIAGDDRPGIPEGTVTAYSSVRTAVVDKIGTTPSQ